MQLTNRLGNLGVLLAVLLNIAVWMLFPPLDDGARPNYTRQFTAEVIGSSAMVLMAASLFLSTRPKYLERFFGGLDRMYHTHKNAGLAALLLIVVHFLVMPLDVSLDSSGNPLGMFALIGLLVLILLSVSPRLPLISSVLRFSYSRWLKTHRFIGLFFIIGFVHAIAVSSMIVHAPVPFAVLIAAFCLGAGSYLYCELLGRFLHPSREYTVDAVERLNGTTVEIALRSQAEAPSYRAGQFAFISFPADKTLREPHPFTISSAPGQGKLRFAIKASGDWTRELNERLEAGMAARVDGCYGRFNYRDGGRRQIWIAAGIGITPFISWIRGFGERPDTEIDLFYTVRSQQDVLFGDEIARATLEHDGFRAHLTISSEQGNLTADQIAATCAEGVTGAEVYICGPIGMIDAMNDQFKRLGVARSRIHYEEFNFR